MRKCWGCHSKIARKKKTDEIWLCKECWDFDKNEGKALSMIFEGIFALLHEDIPHRKINNSGTDRKSLRNTRPRLDRKRGKNRK